MEKHQLHEWHLFPYENFYLVAMLQFMTVRKAFDHRYILSIPDFMLPEGTYWLQGINGSGKTTLLKIIAGMIPFTGHIRLSGTDLLQNPTTYRRLVSYSEAEPVYPSFITGMELIRFYREVRKGSQEQISRLTELLGFDQFLSKPVGNYSSGMVKRLSLLLAFIGNSKLIVLDEPLATLDAEAALLLPGLISEYRSTYGTSFIFSSHAAFTDNTLAIDRKLQLVDQNLRYIS